jgi:hypothetical protein
MWIGIAPISLPGLGHVGTRKTELVWIAADETIRLSRVADR